MVQTSSTVRLPRKSRYLNTVLLQSKVASRDNRSLVFFGRWEPPEVLETRPTSFYQVQIDEANPPRPDMIAYRVYGDTSLFWPLALRNGIRCPLRDVTPGQVLVVPNLIDVQEALSRAAGSGTRAGVR